MRRKRKKEGREGRKELDPHEVKEGNDKAVVGNWYACERPELKEVVENS